MANEIIKNMTNLGDSGQDSFVGGYAELAKMRLYEFGVSKAFVNSQEAEYILAKIVTDLIEDGDLSQFTINFMKDLRVNHPHEEDNV